MTEETEETKFANKEERSLWVSVWVAMAGAPIEEMSAYMVTAWADEAVLQYRLRQE